MKHLQNSGRHLSLEELEHLQPLLVLRIKLRSRVVAVKVFHHVLLHIRNTRLSRSEICCVTIKTDRTKTKFLAFVSSLFVRM